MTLIEEVANELRMTAQELETSHMRPDGTWPPEDWRIQRETIRLRNLARRVETDLIEKELS